MYISQKIIEFSLGELRKVHPFFGITYLACKANNLPIGESVEFPIAKYEQKILETYYKPESGIDNYFTPFKTTANKKYWLQKNYPDKGGQRTRTGNFKEVFIHETKSNSWGWANDYIKVLEEKSDRYGSGLINTFYLVTWLYRATDWKPNTTIRTICDTFFKEFNISLEEQNALFYIDDSFHAIFHEEAFSWDLYCKNSEIELPEGTNVNDDSILEYLEITNVGSVNHVAIDFAKRINILAGDNGLGKTLIQEFCWWALTQKWSESPITPRLDGTSAKSSIKYKTVGNKKGFSPYQEATFDWRKSDWVSSENVKNNPSLALYCRVDGSIATWDTTRPLKDINPIFFSREQVWNGIVQPEQGRNNYLCNGLLYDWANWQIKESEEFDLFCKILKKLSPPDLAVGDVGQLKPGKIIRIPSDTRDIPTLEMPYGLVPITQSSAAIKRILSLAYLIVWTWSEHKNRIKLFGEQNLSQKLVILIDELEAHLHPQWQRIILPALLEIQYFLEEELEIQFILTTHSPLVLASIEPIFDVDKDKLFHFDLDEHYQATITEMPFQKRGTVDSWLTSDVFELSLARSIESEKALNQAKEIMMDRSVDKDSSELSAVHNTLLNVLNAHDPFWVRWNFFVQQKGITV